MYTVCICLYMHVCVRILNHLERKIVKYEMSYRMYIACCCILSILTRTQIESNRCWTRPTARELASSRDARAAPRHARLPPTHARERFGGTRRAGMPADVPPAMPSRPAPVTSLLHCRLRTCRVHDSPQCLARPHPVSLAAVLSLSLKAAGPLPWRGEGQHLHVLAPHVRRACPPPT